MSHCVALTSLERDAGLTLIEMLVVLAIIGVASGATVLSLGSHGPGAEVEARRLAGTIQAGADAAMTGNAPISLRADAGAYQVGPNRHVLPDGMRLEGAPVAPVTLDDNSAVDLTLVRGDEAWNVRFDGLRATAARAVAAR
ncbi:prepilin-type N-terminal cleavage/methylation domain-containing protein [Glacieibacterium megasporae]|uniref:prepilin-type N-terminal cleavage/methylation domain-containing protein n=1 Tax=Glacieibacterium megasporae TaxID=2835787 RepID=UPI001C1E258C|nr:prepilin-type N-terminal cleavage/methylation domain-containing protein [Polymorphobacter megasporae]UAJ10262.1 prepilin-type N-terminal cleavage/methylation domain-containing protein [Polymorphobacter megasporae]